tara:strand:+ start:537 stop:848 length:312 start_codon:yes stop_codon:yes gene_type:complete
MVAEGVPADVDRHSNLPYKYGLLHSAQLYRSFNKRSIVGCFYDPHLTKKEEEKYKQTPSLLVAEDLAQRLIELPAFIDVTMESLSEICEGMLKVMENIDELAS